MKAESKNIEATQVKYQILGWILFLLCAVFYFASSLRSEDILSLIGSVIFLFACVVFIVPLTVKRKRKP
jgi:hypothetical protein